MTWFVLFLFIAVQLGAGAWASRHVSSESDYFVAGRRLGLDHHAARLRREDDRRTARLGRGHALDEMPRDLLDRATRERPEREHAAWHLGVADGVVGELHPLGFGVEHAGRERLEVVAQRTGGAEHRVA